MDADKRRLKTKELSASIGVHPRLIKATQKSHSANFRNSRQIHSSVDDATYLLYH